jgi:GntR family transcriptional regulator/MocR family aminotransferase
VFAPGVRIGYVAAPTPLLRDMIARRFYLDRQGEHVTEAALAELIEEGELSRHIRRMRRLYRARRDHCVQLLRAQLGDALTFNVPNGGMALWARAANGIDVARWALAAEQESVVFQSGQQFRWDGKPSQQLRLGFAGLTEPELTEAVRRLVKSLQNVRSQG